MSNESARYTAREEVLTKTTDAVMGARNNKHGPPKQDFDRSVLNSLGFQFQSGRIHSHHIAMIQMAVKQSRLSWSPTHETHGWTWLDAEPVDKSAPRSRPTRSHDAHPGQGVPVAVSLLASGLFALVGAVWRPGRTAGLPVAVPRAP